MDLADADSASSPVLSNRLLEKFKTPVEIYRADHEALQLVKGISNRQIEGILCLKSLDKSKEILDMCNKKKKYQFSQTKILAIHLKRKC